VRSYRRAARASGLGYFREYASYFREYVIPALTLGNKGRSGP